MCNFMVLEAVPSDFPCCSHVRRAVVGEDDLLAGRAKMAGHRSEGGRVRLAAAETVAEEQAVGTGEHVGVPAAQRLFLQWSVVREQGQQAIPAVGVEDIDDSRARQKSAAPCVVD